MHYSFKLDYDLPKNPNLAEDLDALWQLGQDAILFSCATPDKLTVEFLIEAPCLACAMEIATEMVQKSIPAAILIADLRAVRV